MRDTPNFDDANFALRLYELRREPELRKARVMVGNLLDGAPFETFEAVMDYGHAENAHFRQVTSFWGMCASFVNRGIFHPDIFLDTCGEALYMYSVFKPHLAKIRAGNAMFMMQIERLINDHPAIKERVDVVDKSRAAYAAKEAAQAAAAAAKKKVPAARASAPVGAPGGRPSAPVGAPGGRPSVPVGAPGGRPSASTKKPR